MAPMPERSAPRSRPRSGGFTLIEVVVVLLIFGIVIAMAAAITRGVVAAQKRSLTAARIATVDAALTQFVLQQRRLPCPADGTLASGNANAGIEGARTAAGCSGNQQHGVVPWRALALAETDATDGWDRRLTYRLDASLGADNGMNMSMCDPAGTGALVGTGCNPACAATALASCTPPATFLANKGLRIQNVAGTLLMNPAATPHTGAAYVVISPGESGGGGYLSSGQLSSSNTTDGTEEVARNYANVAYVSGAWFVDDSLNETAGATHFDDIVSRPSILSLASKAGLGPRAH
jgi:prepilin-type N-terminal cleavage/methylation domain-containing protein